MKIFNNFRYHVIFSFEKILYSIWQEQTIYCNMITYVLKGLYFDKQK